MDTQQAQGNSGVGAGADVSDKEARLREAMKHLKLLHIKSRLLRSTIPKMIEPIMQKQPSPEVMYAAFTKSLEEAQANITEFTELMRSEKSKEVFAMTSKSKEEDPFDIKPWRHQDHPNWFNLDKDD
ncbi:hypothetical protein ISF_07129 [Cordyceps fumosorosea ARSEF 2679]|uniref:Uncharacterized protein n=1 Tax=Cordyceps fumosorosea (strain ARSEF 2679) TaxID=1081104 RepID=A0A162K7M2_CORFA|nr:hypothetical protein ISF_07129 [Cordyceps fumosorosea ARSEF 2679]OAA57208.1 hypothetical protein ISF_07129 [Cordyceps fumosorosea ARSEF 2679]